jgi:hypothetical protein
MPNACQRSAAATAAREAEERLHALRVCAEAGWAEDRELRAPLLDLAGRASSWALHLELELAS